ncbi:hypothetical protein [Roseibium sediminicola]|uniref:Uncharacterized protein n=1 Tax=Roseibium sediminicola TaxID=2933272 RepID=A0ABT0GZ59_9HYPH|nr:hypothetical protein [Roseibium sp. CAU 1639]MCK7614716.1 hypothetical protein [Roseibium sp. CAU 1639]
MMRQENTDFGSSPTGLPQSLGSEIRAVLKRPDLTDETLLAALDRDTFPVTACLSLSDFKRGLGQPEQRLRLIRCLAVPAPQHGLEMPEHDLNPPLGVRMAPFVRLWQRLQPAARAQMKQVPVTARNQ